MAISLWENIFGPAITIKRLPGFKKGLIAIVINQPISNAKLYQHRLELIKLQLDSVIKKDAHVVLVDEGAWESESVLDESIVLPFLERPVDDDEAVSELKRLMDSGANYIVISWLCFWWREHYKKFFEYMCLNFTLLVENHNIIVFELR